MNKRERREQYLATRRPPEFFEERKRWQEATDKYNAFFTKYPDFAVKTKKEQYDLLVEEGFIPPSVTLENIFGVGVKK